MVFYSHNYLNYTENLYIRHTAIIHTMTFETIFSMMDKRYVDSDENGYSTNAFYNQSN